MYPTRLTDLRSKPCSCNDCTYKTRSFEDIISNGSRIDRLYYNKFLPLRERKLLEKLVRTRAVYDDVRNRILSGSNTRINVSNDEDIKIRRKILRTDDVTDSNTIHTLVNLVDRGELPPINSPVNLHSECCTCCACNSKIKLTNPPNVHMHIPSLKHVNEYLANHKKRVNREKKSVHYRSILSDPCICTFRFSKKRNKRNLERKYAQTKEQHVREKSSKMVQKQRPTAHHKQVVIEQKTTKNLKCECISSTGAIKHKMRDSIRSSVTRMENVFRIKKDSLTLFREKVRKNQALWTCDPGYCIANECIPHECYDRIKMRHINKKLYHRKKINATRSRSTISSQPSAQYESLKNISIPKPRRPKMFLKTSQASYKLNRCFCTLQLGKQTRKPMKLPSPPNAKLSKASFTVKPKPPKSLSKTNLTKNVTSKNVKCLCEIKQIHSTSKQSSKTENVKKLTSLMHPMDQLQNLNLLPYECEPTICNPGICDPLLCRDKIRLRNPTNSQNFSQLSNTVPINKRTKVTSASATKTPPRSIRARVPKQRKQTLKSKQPVKLRTTEATYTPKSISSPNAPTRQVVRIGSSFRFDIEFFKDRNHPDAKKVLNTTRSYVETPKMKLSSSTSSSRAMRTKATRVSQKMSQKKINTTHADTMNEPLLKRCLCTLKMLAARQKARTNKHSPSLLNEPIATKYDVNKGNEKALNGFLKSRSSMTTAVVNYVIPPQNFPQNLLPYECEPYFCTPGKCDPYVCEKRIRMRNQSLRSTETNTAYTPSNSVSSITSSVTSRSAGTYPRRQKGPRHRNNSSSSRAEHSKRPYVDTSKSSVNAQHRQAVKIGSSFRFDIEFSKNKINTEDKENTYDSQESRTLEKHKRHRRERLHRRDRRIGGGHTMDRGREKRIGEGPHMNSRMSQSSRSVTSRPTATDNFLKRCFCTLKLQKKPQLRGKRVMTSDLHKYNRIPGMSTQTRPLTDSMPYMQPLITSDLLPYECEPNFCVPGQCNPIACEKRIRQRNLLKRCFCTLKFHTQDMSSGSGPGRVVVPIQSRTIGTETPRNRYQKYGHKLLPYECEPGVCVPDQCNPYECQKRIDRRNMRGMQTKYVHTTRPGRRSAYSGSSAFTKTQDSQASFKQPRERHAKGTKYKKRTVSGGSSPSTTSYSPSLSNKSRQAVKLSSQISFNIEFYKNKKLSPGIELHQDKYDGDHGRKGGGRMKTKRAYTQGFRISRDRGMRTGTGYHSRNSQADSDRSDKSTYAESRPERCFCTLKLHKNGRHQRR